MSQTKKRIHRHFPMILGIFLTILGILLLTYKMQTHPVTESKVSEMKRVPPDIAGSTPRIPATPMTAWRVPILMYHYVEYVTDKKDTLRQALDVIPPVFESQVKTLVEAGYTFLTASDLADIMDGKRPLPDKPVLLTFDDGHWDLDTVVLPILKKYHVRATSYVISGFIGRSDFLSRTQLADVAASGLVELGAHTVHHVSLKGKLEPIVALEVNESKKQLEQMIGRPVVSFAYPNGAFDTQAIGAVTRAGFRTAVSTIPGITVSGKTRYYLYRLRPGGRTGKQLITFLETATDRPPVQAPPMSEKR